MNIQKFKPEFQEGSIRKQSIPFTQLCNKTIQTCTNMEAIGMWAYLQSMPESWTLNPAHLKKHFNIGKNKVYKILTYLIEAKLIVRHVQTSAQGTRVKTTYTVLNGTEFLEPARVVEQCAPLPQNPEMDNPEMDNGDYIKERGLEKKEEDIKEISNNNSATTIAQKQNDITFDEFWKSYPIKKNKVRAKRIWDKEKFASIVTLICCDVLMRTNSEPQWQNKQFIPHPSTYLSNKLWNDEVTQGIPPKKSSGKSSSFDAYQEELKQQMRGTTYEHSAISQ